MIRKYPRGATHCKYPTAVDEQFYRQTGDHLEFFVMGRGEWHKSDKPVEYLNQLHRLEE